MLSPQDITVIRGLFQENNALLDKKFEAINTKFEKIIADLDKKFEDRFDWLGQVLKSRFEAIDERFDNIEAKMNNKPGNDEASAWNFRHDQRISLLEDSNRVIKTKLQLE